MNNPAARRDFKLRFLLDPAFVVRRLRGVHSFADVRARAADVLRYAFYRFIWDPYYAVRSVVLAPSRVLRRFWPRAYYRLAGQTNRRFCSRPFRMIHVREDGTAFPCRPDWTPAASIGDFSKQSLAQIWNGEKAREVRRSILDNSFRYCDVEQCLHLKNADGPVRVISELMDEELKGVVDAGQTVMPRGPAHVLRAFDRPDLQGKVDEALQDAEILSLAGPGVPFASPASADWLRSLSAEKLGAVGIHLLADAETWTPEAWNALPADARRAVVSAEISVEAATPEGYAACRPGVGFEKLAGNLDFIGELRRRGFLEYLEISMVVRDTNFREMPSVVRLGRRLTADRVQFLQMGSACETLSPEEFARRAVHRPSHPDFPELGRILRDPIFREPIAFLGSLRWL
ncbi:MAG: SPASM domain-containing protein [Elusimicrobiota bacterium]